MRHIVFVILLMLGLTQAARAEVWKSVNAWNEDWEHQYAEWIRNRFTEDVFMKGRWEGISTDCAQAVYTARILFSYENKLPYAIKDSTGGSVLITNKMGRWDEVKDDDQRVRDFVDYVKSMTNTKTLPEDTYPIAMNREQMKPGVVWVRPSRLEHGIFTFLIGSTVPGHSETVIDVEDTGVVDLLGSTVPEKVRKLFSTTSLVYYPLNADLGFRRWIQPQNQELARESQPGFSLEQYEMGDSESEFEKNLYAKLALRPETKEETITRYSKDLCTLAWSRIELVRDALTFQQTIGGRCLDAGEYDNYSTPSRDARIKGIAERLLDIVDVGLFTSNDTAIDSIDALDRCNPLTITSERKLTMKEYIKNVVHSRPSSDPNDPVLPRWGLAEPENRCPSY